MISPSKCGIWLRRVGLLEKPGEVSKATMSTPLFGVTQYGGLGFTLLAPRGLNHRATSGIMGAERPLLLPLVPSTNPLGSLTAISI